MGNVDNFGDKRHKLTVAEQSAGGKKGAKTRLRNATIRQIAAALMEQPCKKNARLESLAIKLGLDPSVSFKELFTLTELVYAAKKGNIQDMIMVAQFLGEFEKDRESMEVENDPITQALEETAKKLREEREAGEGEKDSKDEGERP